MPAYAFRGGGSLDGAVRFIPPGVEAAVTVSRGGSRSFYVLDDSGTAFGFTGFGAKGRAMGEIMRRFREAARLEQEAVDEAMRPRGCGACGGVFGSEAAFQVHREDGWPGGCLPPGAFGQLEERDGVWVLPWSDAANR